jgi:hypothetical protein
MVGPASSEWKVLRATDGERFVIIWKRHIFSRDLLSSKTNQVCERLKLMFKILLYAIIYPLAIELFAFQNYRRARVIHTRIRY